MFKTSFDLPKPKKETGKLKNRKERQLESKVGADDLQAMFRELGRSAPDTKAVEEIPQENQAPSKDKKRQNSDEPQQKKKQRVDKEFKKDPKATGRKGEKKSDEKDPQQSVHEPSSDRPSKKSDAREKPPKVNEPKEVPKKAPPKPIAKNEAKLTPMQLKMQQKLSGGRFRWINEQLYTVPSEDAVKLFEKSPEMFNEYHSGFRHQVESWPENPVDNMVKLFKERLLKPLSAPGGLPADRDGQVVVADMGCGEAQLALQVSKLKGSSKSRKVKFKVHSFDLHKANERITVADIANTPLPNESAHVVIFCLALMGTNTEDFIKEALRIVKLYGEIWIAEIKSRFDIVKNKTDTQRFVDKLKSYGLHHKSTDDSNKMFVTFQFVNLPKRNAGNDKPKFIDEREEDNAPLLKPCIYKKR